MKNKNAIIGLVLVIVLVAVGVFYFFGNKTVGRMGSKSPTPTPVSSTGNRHEPVSDIEIVGTDFAFTPSTIVARAKKPLKITFKNNGSSPHNMTIKGIGGSKTIQPGQSETFTVIPPKAGLFPITCTVDSHAQKGMQGLLMIQ